MFDSDGVGVCAKCCRTAGGNALYSLELQGSPVAGGRRLERECDAWQVGWNWVELGLNRGEHLTVHLLLR